ncbi:FtsX-like permease family protein [Marinobacter persicus]|uniref:ABC transport system permease protein n=1 Tax=Marinobacter persicus TaxID=930118 RepID=A0A2S6G3J9_9GAMM|nr:ABC transporter permease [Marinobacter persicus]PPK50400.1 putative ABC transport system permease protein [Marinobacter persicus]PPK53455.1 putative ABC transport system permease protein [Marinobacter persicus]PPK56919.1 putative ABC transport system permease protein [Marinobacter persicus]
MTLPAALLSHYRRHPLQLLALAIMIILATMLWTGVHHLTSQARGSLEQSESAVAERQQVVRADGQPMTVADFVELRRQGFCVMPWLEVSRPADGRIVGIDPLAAACFGSQADGAPEPGNRLDGKPFVDISKAAELAADHRHELTLLIVPATTNHSLPAGYEHAAFQVGPDTGELGESFLLNLDALGVLVLLITALLVRSVYLLGLAQRRDSFALLHRYGVPQRQISQWLVVELLVLALICIFPGVWLGRWLASALGNGFGQALESLFDTPLYAGDSGGWTAPVLTMVAVVLTACLADGLRPWLRRLLRSFGPRHQHWWPLLLILLLGLVLVIWTHTLFWLFTAVAIVFVAFGVLAPRVLSGLADWRASRAGDPMVRWRHRELSVLARRLALPLVALQFAMTLVLAVQALVTTFENTFDQWLAQRLEAPFYIEVPAGADASLATHWLNNASEEHGLGPWHRVIRGRATVAKGPENTGQAVDVFGLGPIGPLVENWRLLDSVPAPWQRLHENAGVMVNEQLARRQGIQINDTLKVSLGGDTMTLPVLAVYPDYGRPAGEILVPATLLPETFDIRFQSLSITPGQLTMEAITGALEQLWGREQLTVRNNRTIQALASNIFDQTFLLTRAMTVLTLILSGTALLLMGWVFFSTRAWYFRLLLVWGLQRREATLQLMRLSLSLTGAITLLALPLGIWLTWVLVHRINPLAFGWSLPMAVYPAFWLQLGAMSLLIGLSITLLMRYQLKNSASTPVSANALAGGER